MSNRMYMQTAQALGTNIELRISCINENEADKVFGRMWVKIENFDKQFSRFLPSSEITNLNARAGQRVEISSDLNDILEKSQYYSIVTDGLFNPFILPAVQRAGYVKSLVNNIDPIDYADRVVVDFSHLELGKNWARIPKNTAIDLGGIGKGYLADEIASMIDGDVNDYCLSFGGDMVIKGNNGDSPWVIDVQSTDIMGTESYCCNKLLDRMGVATSGLARNVNGETRNHLIDPSSGKTITKTYSTCSVAARDAVSADVFASTILISGVSHAQNLINHGLIQGVLLLNPGSSSVILGDGFEANNHYSEQYRKGVAYA